MADIFISIVNMSINAVWVIAAVIILRFFLKNVSKKYMMVLWALVGLRLVCPFTMESMLSLLPSANVVSNVSPDSFEPVIVSGIDSVDNMINPVMQDKLETLDDSGVNKIELFFSIAGCIWGVIFAYILLYLAVSYFYMKKKTDAKMLFGDKIWLCDDIDTPFILGVLKPQIYLPSSINPVQSDYVIKHERMHLKYYDYIWKPLGFIILAVHWFNPLVWAAYILFGRDMELACDERVIRNMNLENRKYYSRALLELSTGRRNIAACPLAFGEVGVKQRIRKVLNYRKPAFWAGIISAAACIKVAVCFLTNPVSSASEILNEVSPELDKAVSDAILSESSLSGSEQEYVCEDHIILGTSKPQEDIVDVYAMVLCSSYVKSDSGIKESSGYHAPNVITLRENKDGSYSLQQIWHPSDGSDYESSIHDRFPHEIYNDACDTRKYINEQRDRCHTKAQHHFSQKAGNYGDSDNITEDSGNSDNNYGSDYGYHHEEEYGHQYESGSHHNEYYEHHSNSGVHHGISQGKVMDSTDLDMGSNRYTTVAGNSFEDVKTYLAGLPGDVEGLADAGCFVITYKGVSGVENWNNFITTVNAGEPAELVCVQYTVEGDEMFDYMYYTGEDIYHVWDFRRDKFCAGSENDKCFEETYDYIKVFDYVEDNGDKVKDIILTNRSDITMDDYMKEVFSDNYDPEKPYSKAIAKIVYGNKNADITGDEAWHDLSYEYDMSKHLLNAKKVYSIVVTKSDTGETKEYRATDGAATFNELLSLYGNLDAAPHKDSDNLRGGCAYRMEFKDHKGNFLQTVTPYKDAVCIDYKMYNCSENGTSCELLLALNKLDWQK